MITPSSFRNGLKLLFKNKPHSIVEFQHVKPGKGPAFIRTKLRDLTTGSLFEHKFRSNDKLEQINLDDKDVTYTYRDGEFFCFMDSETYEELRLTEEGLGDAIKWITEGMELSIVFYDGEPLTVNLPSAVDLTVTQTDPGEKGNTVTGGSKPATLETGAVVQVPLFITEGDVLRIDTRTGEYVTRVKT